MQYEYLFWSMLGVVAAAILGGALIGRAKSVANAIGMCLVWATLLACIVMSLLHGANIEDGSVILGIATFMFAWVISTAFALLVRRVLTQRAARPS